MAESSCDVKYGLVAEAKRWAEVLQIPDPAEVWVSTETVSEAVWRAARSQMWESVVSSKHIRAPVLAERTTPDYFFDTTMSNHDQMIWFAYRLGILEFKRRFSNKYLDKDCIYKDCREEDTLDHSLECEYNPVKLRGSGDGHMLEYLKELHESRVAEWGVGLYFL